MTITFKTLKLPEFLLEQLEALGYETPTPVQTESIPILLSGADLLAQAQTGTGKTAAFALPILSKIDLKIKAPQALIIAPTRELAMQVADAFKTYARGLKGFTVTPIYGGQDYPTQLKALKSGSHVVVGTPGRVMDHLRRGTLTMEAIKTLVLDEADEMLKMGFIDDVEWILGQITQEHQTALFSATLPASIKKIAERYLKEAEKVNVKAVHDKSSTIQQFYVRVTNKQKFEALTRFLETEAMDATLIFTRTKDTSSELAEKLQALGYSAAALNGDMAQNLRKKVIQRITHGSLDIVIATDVAARGIDIDRIGHVFNYDIPQDVETYTHRIGRTGRAGRTGKALLFLGPRDNRLLQDIERNFNKNIQPIEVPSVQQIAIRRSEMLAEKISSVILKSKHLKPYHTMVEGIREKLECSAEDIAAALAYLSEQAKPMPTHDMDTSKAEPDEKYRDSSAKGDKRRGFEKRHAREFTRDRAKPRYEGKKFSEGPSDRAKPRYEGKKFSEGSSDRAKPRYEGKKFSEGPSDRAKPRYEGKKFSEGSSDRAKPRYEGKKSSETSGSRDRAKPKYEGKKPPVSHGKTLKFAGKRTKPQK